MLPVCTNAPEAEGSSDWNHMETANQLDRTHRDMKNTNDPDKARRPSANSRRSPQLGDNLAVKDDTASRVSLYSTNEWDVI